MSPASGQTTASPLVIHLAVMTKEATSAICQSTSVATPPAETPNEARGRADRRWRKRSVFAIAADADRGRISRCGRCCPGDGGDPRSELHSTPFFFSRAEALLSPTHSGECPQPISNPTRQTNPTGGLSTRLAAKRSSSLHTTLLLSTPTVPTDSTTRTSLLPRRRKSGAHSSLPRRTTESLPLLK